MTVKHWLLQDEQLGNKASIRYKRITFNLIKCFYRLLCCFWVLQLLWLILAMEAMAMDAAMATEAMVMVVMEVMVEDIMEKEMLMQRL